MYTDDNIGLGALGIPILLFGGGFSIQHHLNVIYYQTSFFSYLVSYFEKNTNG